VEAERRQVTVLFTDMVRFTTFSERSGEEAVGARSQLGGWWRMTSIPFRRVNRSLGKFAMAASSAP